MARWKRAEALIMIAGIFMSAAFNSAYAFHAAVDSLFNSPDPFVQSTVIPNIEKYRKADVVLRCRSADGSALAGVQVQANMIKHSFLFGCCPPPNEPRRSLFLQIFNFGLPENAGKWASLERTQDNWNFSSLDELVNWAESNGVTLEEHFLSGYVPTWAQSLGGGLAARQLLHMRKVVDRYGTRFRFYQVDNEAKIANATLWDSMKVSFPQYKDRFGICDNLNMTYWDQAGLWTMPGPAEVERCWPGCKFAANQVHCATMGGTSGDTYSPRQFYEGMFNKYLGSDMPIHLTEFDFPCPGTIRPNGYLSGTMTEDRKAIYYVQLATVSFSHPSVEAINFWGFGPGGYMPGSGFVDGSNNPLPCFNAMKSLVTEKLRTTSNGASDAQGDFTFRGFLGFYELVVTGPNGLSIRDTFELKPSQSPVVVLVTSQGVQSPAAKPMISPAGGFLVTPVQVTITDSTPGAQIRYTLDGADPTESSTMYSAPFTLSAPATIKARAYKTGMSPSEVGAATFRGLLAAENPAGVVAGLDYSYYQGHWDVLPDFQTMTPVRTGTASLLDLTPANGRTLDFGMRFEGYIDIPADGIYTFSVTCDDAVELSVSSVSVVKSFWYSPGNGQIGLKAGKHSFRMDFFQGGGPFSLAVNWECQTAGIAKQTIPAANLFHGDNSSTVTPRMNRASVNHGPVTVYTIRGQRVKSLEGSVAGPKTQSLVGARGVFVTVSESARWEKAKVVAP